MARGIKRELFDCEHCQNSQPLPSANGKSVTCIKCGTEYAIVVAETDDGDKVRAVVPYFYQKNN